MRLFAISIAVPFCSYLTFGFEFSRTWKCFVCLRCLCKTGKFFLYIFHVNFEFDCDVYDVFKVFFVVKFYSSQNLFSIFLTLSSQAGF